jgi:hypothetical protein
MNVLHKESFSSLSLSSLNTSPPVTIAFSGSLPYGYEFMSSFPRMLFSLSGNSFPGLFPFFSSLSTQPSSPVFTSPHSGCLVTTSPYSASFIEDFASSLGYFYKSFDCPTASMTEDLSFVTTDAVSNSPSSRLFSVSSFLLGLMLCRGTALGTFLSIDSLPPQSLSLFVEHFSQIHNAIIGEQKTLIFNGKNLNIAQIIRFSRSKVTSFTSESASEDQASINVLLPLIATTSLPTVFSVYICYLLFFS